MSFKTHYHNIINVVQVQKNVLGTWQMLNFLSISLFLHDSMLSFKYEAAYLSPREQHTQLMHGASILGQLLLQGFR